MADPNSQDMILGELRGQVRELVHGVNNLSQKFDGLTREVIGLGPIATTVANLDARVAALEAAQQREAGAHGVFGAIMRSPALGWIIGGATTLWALLTGRLHL